MAKVDHKKPDRYQPQAWLAHDPWFDDDAGSTQREPSHPGIHEQISVLELLGRINYKIIKGSRVYIEAGGVVYKTLYGGYWRSVFTGVEHHLLHCEQVSGCVWAAEDDADTAIDLPITYSNEGWTTNGHSLSFMLARD